MQVAKADHPLKIGIIGDVYLETEDKMVKPILDLYAPKDPMRPKYNVKEQKITWSNGCVAYVVQAESPKKLRGYNFEVVWIDEIAKFQYLEEFWNQLLQCVRIGVPKIMISTTQQIRSNRLIKELKAGIYGKCVITTGRQSENLELNAEFREINLRKWKGTRFGVQELDGGMIEELSGTLWDPKTIKHLDDFVIDEANRSKQAFDTVLLSDFLHSKLIEVVIAIDPAVTKNMLSDETGIVICARDKFGRGFVLEDRSGKYTPNQWATIIAELYNKYREYNVKVTVLAEVNNGGDLVSAALHQVLPQIKMQEIRANKGKLLRAEPVGTLYERGIIYHLARGNGRFEQLEDQMVNFTGYEPQKADQEVVEIERLDHDDRLDALVYGMRYLFSEECNPRKIGYIPFKFLNFQ